MYKFNGYSFFFYCRGYLVYCIGMYIVSCKNFGYIGFQEERFLVMFLDFGESWICYQVVVCFQVIFLILDDLFVQLIGVRVGIDEDE